MMGFVVGMFDSLVVGSLRRMALRGRAGETYAGKRLMQHYGFASSPLIDCEVLALENGGMVVIVAEDDRRYRIALAAGEVALHDDQGQSIHLKRNKVIEISGCDQLNLGDVRANLKRLIDERVIAWLNAHTHICTAPGAPSSEPIVAVVLADVATDIARAK